MKRYIIYIGLLISIITACTDEEWTNAGSVGDKEVWATLKFGHQSFDKVDIETRATLDEIAESRVQNMFVYVFSATGQRLYSHYYDYTNRVESLPTTAGNYWTVENRTSTNNNDTHGEIKIKAPALTGGSIYAIANLNADQLNISAGQLNTIGTLSELQALTVSMNQEITSRTGYFLMSGHVDNISIAENGAITQGNAKTVTLPLVRLDAKVTVNVQVGQATIDGQRMADFEPESWQIMRLPKGTLVLPKDNTDADQFGYFDAPEQHFESDDNGVKSFSFYMLENMENTTGLTSYNERDLRSKKTDGTYDTSNGLWANASEDATYMVIKGKIQMEVDTNEETGMQYLEADVTYYVHLGNFGNSASGGNYNDFTIKRNTHYTYTITIKGVNNIELEVTTDVEYQSGATGHVYKSKEEIYTFDAHYGQRVFRIDAESVLDKTVTWYVKTPFSEGTPGMESGTQIPNLDYRWVWFMVNKTENDGVYSANNRTYPGNKYQAVNFDENDKLMNVVEFTNFIRDEKVKFKNAAEDEKPTASAFKKDHNEVYCLYVTAFVDEFYYEADPLNSENKPADLWKKFVNQPNRIMHILCDSQLSKDNESSVTSSVITIRQHSIQTPYNIKKEGLLTAFGCETVDETRPYYFTFYEDDNNYRNVNFGNNSTNNGLYNTACLWNLLDNGSVKIESNRERWSTYLNYDIPNTIDKDNHFFKEGKESMRYAPMSRNRDNNGNGFIDPEEVRWYIAPLEQLYALYVGDLGLVSEAQLYPSYLSSLSNSKVNNKWQWRNHLVCSNQTTIKNRTQYIDPYWPEMLWAEEGVSISGYGQEWEKQAPNSIRCIRNLGLADASVQTLADKTKNVPEPMIKVKTKENVYSFDMSNINERSARYFTTSELMIGDENSEASRTYFGFETDDVFIDYNQNYTVLKTQLENDNGPCPAGYRLPNVREAALMSLYCSQEWWNDHHILSSSYYSHGSLGSNYDNGTITWFFEYKYITISGSSNSLRCVKDWKPE